MTDQQDLFKVGCPSRVYFVASKPAIEKASHSEIFFTREDAERALRWTSQIHFTPLKVYSALVVVEEETNG